jgi:hypothetical protein
MDSICIGDGNKPAREFPFNPNIKPRTPADLGARLGLPDPYSAGHLAMRNALLANLQLARMHDPHARLYYSRDAAHYASSRCWSPPSYTRRIVTEVVDELERARLISHNRTRPSPTATRRSTMAAEPGLISGIGIQHIDELCYRLHQPIVLKNDDGQPMRFRSSRQTRIMIKDIEAQNDLLDQLAIELNDPAWSIDAHGLYRSAAGQAINPSAKHLHRIFNNGSWREGGRWYGGWWQQLPKASRAKLTIDTAPVVEEDYSACHLRLLAAAAGVPPPAGDPYRIEAIETACAGNHRVARRLAKVAFQILLNAGSFAAAHGALARELATIPRECSLSPGLLMRAIKEQFPAFQRLWHTGVGLRLQRIDSDIAADVMRRLRAHSIPALPIHDSFIVPASSRIALQDAMEAAFFHGLRRAARLSR